MKQTKEATDRAIPLDFGGPNSLVNLGTFHDVVTGHTRKFIYWSFAWQPEQPLRLPDPRGDADQTIASADSIEFAARVAPQERRLVTTAIHYIVDGKRVALTQRDHGHGAYALTASGIELVRARGRPWELPGPSRSYAFPDHAQTYYQNISFLSDLELAYERLMDRIYYLGPLREFPRREYTWSGARPTDVGRRGERVIDAILAATAQGERRHCGPRQRYRPLRPAPGGPNRD